MNVSLNWLSEFVAHGRTADEVADLLTMSGLEVEEIATTGAPSVPDGVIVGHVLTCARHPGADRLSVTTVDVGAETPLAIVCGAPNVAAGQHVAVAPPGTTLQLPGKDGARMSVTLERRKIRGEMSEGMICADDELGLGSDHSGILVLDGDDATPGEPLAAYLTRRSAAPDTVLTLNVTPNRPDATSHAGVARDLAALVDEPLRLPSVDVPEPGGDTAARIAVTLADAHLCSRYVAMIVDGVTVGAAPSWMRERLEAVGSRSVSGVVDATNVVMREIGQPLHAFDLDRIEGTEITVRAARAGETLVTLDGRERTLAEGTPVVCDGGPGGPRVIAIAGVMGGRDTEVTGATTRVLIESAHFDASAIRRAARAAGLSTDASYRFERGVDPEGTRTAAARTAALIAEVAGGTVASGCVDAVAIVHVRPRVTLRLARLAAHSRRRDSARRRAAPAHRHRLRRRRRRRSRRPRRAAHGGPPGRGDLARRRAAAQRAAVAPRRDARDRRDRGGRAAVGLRPDSRAAPHPPTARGAARERRPRGARRAPRGARRAGTDRGRRHVAGAARGGRARARSRTRRTEAAPSSRRSRRPGRRARRSPCARACSRPSCPSRRTTSGSASRACGCSKSDASSAVPSAPPAPTPPPTSASTPPSSSSVWRARPTWDAPARRADLYDAKAAAEAIAAAYGHTATFADAPIDGFDDALTVLVDGAPVGIVGSVGAELLGAYDLRGPVVVAEVNTSALFERGRGRARYGAFSRAPHVERDLAFVVDGATPAGDLVGIVREAGQPLVASVTVVDVYTGDRVGAGRKSIALALRLAADRTLTDAEVEETLARIVTAAGARVGAELRR